MILLCVGNDGEVDFVPTPLVPALQFFEGVDMSGMAMKAGLRPGDFLLQINGVDVRNASHDQVVRLIKASDDTITLKVWFSVLILLHSLKKVPFFKLIIVVAGNYR